MTAVLRRGATKGSRRTRETDAQRKRKVSFLIGTTLAIAGFLCLAVGTIAWQLPGPQPVPVTASAAALLPGSTAFDAGVTLFAEVPDHRNPPAPTAFGCRVSIAGGAPVNAGRKPVPERVGSRVVNGAALTGVIDLDHPAAGAQLLCDGAAASASASLWVLPSRDGPSSQPLAIVVVALLLIGVGVLVHPRTRSM